MTREEAIEKIEKYQCKRVGTVSESELEEALNMAIEALENSQNCVKCVHYYETEDERGVHSHCEQEPKWIPVSERLPNKNIQCLVTTGTLNFVQIAVYSDLMGTIDHKIFWQGEYGRDSFRDITPWVTAWMPLPEPYEGSDAE